MRQAFNDAEAGNVVEIERFGRIYQLVITPFSKLSTDEVSSNIRPNLIPTVEAADKYPDTPLKNNSVATPPDEMESKVQEFAKGKGIKFCPNGHAIPAGRSKCMGKGCKYAF